MGVFIGIYGNWLVALTEKLEQNLDLPVSIFIFSFFPFLWYFQEAFKSPKDQSEIMGLSSTIILGCAYLCMITVVLGLTGVFFSELPFSLTGLTTWYLLMQVERRSRA